MMYFICVQSMSTLFWFLVMSSAKLILMVYNIIQIVI